MLEKARCCTEPPPQIIALSRKGEMGYGCLLSSGGSSRENGQKEGEGRCEGGGLPLGLHLLPAPTSPQLLRTPRNPSALKEKQGKNHHPHLIDEETTAQRGTVTCPRSHSKRLAESQFATLSTYSLLFSWG